MSYVLEALKKAEAQKDPRVRTSLVQEHRERRRSRWLQISVSAALLANLAVILWLFYPRTESTLPAVDKAQVPQDSPVNSNVSAAVAAPEGASPPAAPAAALVAPPLSVTDTPAAAADVPREIRNPAPVRLHLADLPAAPRGRFPGLAFSTHIYAEDPTLRALVVNGARLTQGDRFGALELIEITEEGAVFRFENYLVDVSVLDTWD